MLAITSIKWNSTNWLQTTAFITPLFAVRQSVSCWFGFLSWSTRRGADTSKRLDIGHEQFGEKSTAPQLNIASTNIPGLILIFWINKLQIKQKVFFKNVYHSPGASVWVNDESFGWITECVRKICTKYYIKCCWSEYGIFAVNQTTNFTVLHQDSGEIFEGTKNISILMEYRLSRKYQNILIWENILMISGKNWQRNSTLSRFHFEQHAGADSTELSRWNKDGWIHFRSDSIEAKF